MTETIAEKQIRILGFDFNRLEKLGLSHMVEHLFNEDKQVSIVLSDVVLSDMSKEYIRDLIRRAIKEISTSVDKPSNKRLKMVK